MNRLLGLDPTLEVSGDRLVLSASGPQRATARTATMELAPELIRLFQPGDVLHLKRGAMGGVGTSLLRADRLVFAVGAIHGLPLGDVLSAHIGPRLDFSSPASIQWPRPETWIDVSIAGRVVRLREGEEATIDGYRISVLGAYKDGPGKPESVAISLEGTCSHESAVKAATLVSRLVMTGW